MTNTAKKIENDVKLHEKKAEELHLEDAVALAQQLERYEQAVKLLKNKLKAYVELNGPVQANGKVWDFFQNNSWDIKGDGLKQLAGMMVIEQKNPFDYLTVSANSLKTLGYSDELLSNYGQKKTGNKTFRSVKVENYQKQN